MSRRFSRCASRSCGLSATSASSFRRFLMIRKCGFSCIFFAHETYVWVSVWFTWQNGQIIRKKRENYIQKGWPTRLTLKTSFRFCFSLTNLLLTEDVRRYVFWMRPHNRMPWFFQSLHYNVQTRSKKYATKLNNQYFYSNFTLSFATFVYLLDAGLCDVLEEKNMK